VELGEDHGRALAAGHSDEHLARCPRRGERAVDDGARRPEGRVVVEPLADAALPGDADGHGEHRVLGPDLGVARPDDELLLVVVRRGAPAAAVAGSARLRRPPLARPALSAPAPGLRPPPLAARRRPATRLPPARPARGGGGGWAPAPGGN